MTTHGGKRKGAGRPPLKVRKFYITLTQEQIDWLKSRQNASKTIRNLVEEKMDRQLAFETLNDYCGNTLKDLENWRGMSVEQIEATLRKYDSEVLGETMDRIDQRAKAIYKLANGIDDEY